MRNDSRVSRERPIQVQTATISRMTCRYSTKIKVLKRGALENCIPFQYCSNLSSGRRPDTRTHKSLDCNLESFMKLLRYSQIVVFCFICSFSTNTLRLINISSPYFSRQHTTNLYHTSLLPQLQKLFFTTVHVPALLSNATPKRDSSSDHSPCSRCCSRNHSNIDLILP